MPRRLLVLVSIAAAAVGGGIAWRVADAFRPVRHFMPGELGRAEGAVRIYSQAHAATRREASVNAQTTEDRGPDAATGGSESARWRSPLHDGFLTRYIGLRDGEEAEWGRRNGVTETVPFMHNLANVFPPALAASHPEYFPFADGKRLVPPAGAQYWNPDLGREDVAHFAADEARAYFDKNPAAVSFSLGVNDGLIFGESPETLALVLPQQWFRGRPDYSRLVFTFMNRVAADLATTHRDKYLGCLAYYWCENIPPFPVDPHVIPFYTADRSQSYDPAFRAEEFEMQRKWAEAVSAGSVEQEATKLTKVRSSSETEVAPLIETRQSGSIAPRLGLYDYLDDYGFLVPRVPVHAFAENIRHARDVGFTDYFGESSRNWGLDGPMPWVIAQLLQDPHRDTDALLGEYYTIYFKEAAGPMQRFFERCEQQWMQQAGPSYWLKHYRNESQASLFPSSVCAELRGLLNEAASAAEGGGGNPTQERMIGDKSAPTGEAVSGGEPAAANAAVRRRIAFVSDTFGVTERFVAFCEARTQLTAGLLRNELRGEPLRAATDAYVRARADFLAYTQQVMRRWPLALYPINYDDFLRNDPGFAAALTLFASGGSADGLLAFTNGSAGAGHTDKETVSDFSVTRVGRSALLRNASHSALASRDGRAREICVDGALAGPRVGGRRIAGLVYEMELPAPWQNSIEPTQTQQGKLLEPGGAEAAVDGPVRPPAGRVLRVSGAARSIAYQWMPAKPGALYMASVAARGQVSSSCMVTLLVSWLDNQQKPVGTPVVTRLPDGLWPEWVRLLQGGEAPAGAAWVGVCMAAQNQVDGDWAEFRDVSVKEILPAPAP